MALHLPQGFLEARSSRTSRPARLPALGTCGYVHQERGAGMSVSRMVFAERTPGGCRARAALGAVAWAIYSAVLQPAWADSLLLLAPLVLLPLGLALLVGSGGETGARLLRVAARVQLPAALPLLGALALPAGPTAAILTLPW